MVTININLPAGAGQKASIEATQVAPSPVSSAGKKESKGTLPSPHTTTQSHDLPSPVLRQDFSASTYTEAPRPADISIVKNAMNTAVPTPITQAASGQPGIPQPEGVMASSPKPIKSSKYPTPKDNTSLAQQVNKDIDKAEKPSSRSRSSKSRTKKK